MKKLYMAYAPTYGMVGKPDEDYTKTETGAKRWVTAHQADVHIYELMAVATAPIPPVEVIKIAA